MTETPGCLTSEDLDTVEEFIELFRALEESVEWTEFRDDEVENGGRLRSNFAGAGVIAEKDVSLDETDCPTGMAVLFDDADLSSLFALLGVGTLEPASSSIRSLTSGSLSAMKHLASLLLPTST